MRKNALPRKIAAEYDALYRRRVRMDMQLGQDAAMIAANKVLQLGPGRAAAFQAAYQEAVNAIAALMVEDQKDDKEFVYAKAKIDAQIREIVGDENFVSWEGRYMG